METIYIIAYESDSPFEDKTFDFDFCVGNLQNSGAEWKRKNRKEKRSVELKDWADFKRDL